MSKIRLNFAVKLKQIRLKKKLTQEALAERLGISVRYVQLLEGPSTPNVKLETIENLAEALNCRPKDFF